MTPYYSDDSVTLYHGDCLDILCELPDASVDAVVTDPPYGLEFMGREWDKFAPKTGSSAFTPDADSTSPIKSTFKDGVGTRIGAPKKNPRCLKCNKLGFDHAGRRCACEVPDFDTRTREYAHTFQDWCFEWATECRRVLKPGGHMLAFGGSRTWHRLTCAVEDAGFEIRDSIAWLYGSGFPKSLDVSKAIDKAAGATREVVGPSARHSGRTSKDGAVSDLARYGTAGDVLTAPATPDAERWQGWGTALKPAFEPIVVARKPLAGTVAGNVLAYGTGALNIDGCRVGTDGGTTKGNPPKGQSTGIYGDGINGACDILDIGKGRWPANVVLDESQAAELDKQSAGMRVSKPAGTHTRKGRTDTDVYSTGWSGDSEGQGHEGAGASRFFPVFANNQQEEPCSQATTEDSTSGATDAAKPQRLTTERTPEVGESTTSPTVPPDIGTPSSLPTFRYEPKAPTTERPRDGQTAHPTVKPLDLMRWLVRLVTPPGGIVLEPFAGSGTTAEACVIEGFNCIAIEREADYLPLIVRRLSKPIQVALDFDSL